MDETLMVILLLSGFCTPCTPFRNGYLFINKNMTWDEAYQYCLMEQNELAQIQSLENNISMMNIQTARYTDKAWIGLFENASDWTWVDGETATYFEWGNVQPDNIDTDEYCVTIDNDGRWGFANCSLKKPFVCQDEAGENNFTNWQEGQPDNSNGEDSCAAVVLKDGTWTDEPCNATYPFFCYGVHKARKTVVRMSIKSSANMEDPACSAELQRQLQAALAKKGVTDFKLTWKKLPVKRT
ncbi:hypothetical protein JOQ06_024902 [Pogonophryne albipinna]|uniref:C-type lectin domain-containing protein n=1 Tax=Pogonophryne albipinna TaxID=1090488 RepID=A0AAD6FE56_9TELE|nr:hypothetical protein JOQ06_024902 [Pogonophryne albipinna]